MTKLKKTQIGKKIQNLNCQTKKLKLWQNSKNSNGDKTQTLKLWQNSKTQMVTKPKNQIVTTKKSNSDKTQKIKLWRYL